MTLFLLYPLVAIAATYALWIFFLAVMNLERAKEAGMLCRTAVLLGTPVIGIGYLVDALVNVFVMTFVFLEVPRELTVTARLRKHVAANDGWRSTLSMWFIPILDPFDHTGHHITVPTKE